MAEFRDDAPGPAALSREEIEGDRRLELLLDECVGSSPAPGEELTRRILAARPFAPWEVRQARAWRAPALASAGLLLASLAVFLAPLWSLGPATAAELWVRVLAASASGAVASALAAAPALADAAALVLSRTRGFVAILGSLLALSAGTLALFARRRARRPRRAAVRP
jgi:hypothetical protein